MKCSGCHTLPIALANGPLCVREKEKGRESGGVNGREEGGEGAESEGEGEGEWRS